jgi:hypothetical protein
VAAAELSISLAELSRVLNATLQRPMVRLHNVPTTSSNFTAGSSLSYGNASVPITIPAKTFEQAGVRYAYYVSELASTSVTISPAPSVLRITIVFEAEGTELVGRCEGGICPSSSVLPQIDWVGPTVAIDMTPVWENGNLALNAKKVDIGGSFVPKCSGTAFIAGSICRFILPEARKITGKLKTDLGDELLAQINGPETQAQIATGLRPFLRFGAIGEVRFSRVTVDAETVTLAFCLACEPEIPAPAPPAPQQ